jgi:hypothetical protein
MRTLFYLTIVASYFLSAHLTYESPAVAMNTCKITTKCTNFEQDSAIRSQY